MQSSVKRYANNKNDIKHNFQINIGKRVSNDKCHTFLTYKIDQTKNLFSATHWIRILSVIKTQTFINRLMSYLPKKSPPLAKDEVLARLQSYNLCWSKCINDWRDYDQCSIELWHQTWFNEVEPCRELHCTEEEAKSLIKSNPVILTSCEFFSSCLHNPRVWIETNQVNVVSMQKKDGDLCTVSHDGH